MIGRTSTSAIAVDFRVKALTFLVAYKAIGSLMIMIYQGVVAKPVLTCRSIATIGPLYNIYVLWGFSAASLCAVRSLPQRSRCRRLRLGKRIGKVITRTKPAYGTLYTFGDPPDDHDGMGEKWCSSTCGRILLCTIKETRYAKNSGRENNSRFT